MRLIEGVLVTCLFLALPGMGAEAFAEQTDQPTKTVSVDGRPSCSTCKIVLTEVARLGKAGDSILLDRQAQLAVDSERRFYATAAKGLPVVRYDSTGRLLGVISRSGSGPGEFPYPHPVLHVGPGDTLYAMQGRSTLVFTPELKWVRTYSFPINGWFTVLRDNSKVALGTVFRSSAPQSFPLHLLSSAGIITRSFGSDKEVDVRCSWCFLFAVAPAMEPQSLWSSTPQIHELTKWNVSGQLLERIRFTNSPWFTPWDPDPAGRPPGVVSRIMEVSESNGYVWMRGAKPIARSAEPAAAMIAESSEDPFSNWVSVVEAYDPVRRTIVASAQFPRMDVRIISGNIVATRVESAAGLVTYRISTLTVVRQ